ncbi:hypothetical protein IEQ34_022364 [Dendrobium chrysotoxum]|uniref:Uncharacterized protein n=1 Tax=Dendrobium chrysotoxum TaxID=161865 RepID=A0AAV7FYR1_DENCH|nr:hypothetical protein IEQ34_022364 [Dendrobium chrysotoxum]
MAAKQKAEFCHHRGKSRVNTKHSLDSGSAKRNAKDSKSTPTATSDSDKKIPSNRGRNGSQRKRIASTSMPLHREVCSSLKEHAKAMKSVLPPQEATSQQGTLSQEMLENFTRCLPAKDEFRNPTHLVELVRNAHGIRSASLTQRAIMIYNQKKHHCPACEGLLITSPTDKP